MLHLPTIGKEANQANTSRIAFGLAATSGESPLSQARHSTLF
jgi:hypothetical protein